jgi:hypothetical protein
LFFIAKEEYMGYLEWGMVNWLEVFEKRMEKLVKKDEDEFLLGEYQILLRILQVEGIGGSKLIEFIDILESLLKSEISDRWMKEKESVYGQVG